VLSSSMSQCEKVNPLICLLNDEFTCVLPRGSIVYFCSSISFFYHICRAVHWVLLGTPNGSTRAFLPRLPCNCEEQETASLRSFQCNASNDVRHPDYAAYCCKCLHSCRAVLDGAWHGLHLYLLYGYVYCTDIRSHFYASWKVCRHSICVGFGVHASIPDRVFVNYLATNWLHRIFAFGPRSVVQLPSHAVNLIGTSSFTAQHSILHYQWIPG